MTNIAMSSSALFWGCNPCGGCWYKGFIGGRRLNGSFGLELLAAQGKVPPRSPMANALQSRSTNDGIFQVVEALSEAPINQRRATAPSSPGG